MAISEFLKLIILTEQGSDELSVNKISIYSQSVGKLVIMPKHQPMVLAIDFVDEMSVEYFDVKSNLISVKNFKNMRGFLQINSDHALFFS